MLHEPSLVTVLGNSEGGCNAAKSQPNDVICGKITVRQKMCNSKAPIFFATSSLGTISLEKKQGASGFLCLDIAFSCLLSDQICLMKQPQI